MSVRNARHPNPERRSVLIIGSEARPFAKTGGLADVLGSLPSAIARLGWDVTLALPRYRGVMDGDFVERLPLVVGGADSSVDCYEVLLADGVRVLLFDRPELYDRDGIYGAGTTDYSDNARRFGVLVRAAFEFSARHGARPSLVHAHDWQAGLAPVYLKTLYAGHPVLGGISTVFTIHNLSYQGLFDADWLPRLDLPGDVLSSDRLEFWGRISLLKGGINDAEVITTVSRTYAAEIQTPEYGCGFDGVLRRRSRDLVGILNGIDTKEWDPASDRFLPAPYSSRDLSGKRVAKCEVLARYGLPNDDTAMARPLVGMVSRMVDQKGFDLIADVASELSHLGASFVVLGTGEPRYEDLWRSLAASYPDRIGARIGFDEALAHLIEGGSDTFLMPSQFEPCGLNQMYSLRYGTVPIVRGVGGLADTVSDYVARPAAPKRSSDGPTGRRRVDGAARSTASGDGPVARQQREGGTGFVFHEYTSTALLDALRRALTVFQDGKAWRALQLAGMKEDHSWDRSAGEYVKIYERAAGGGGRGDQV